MHLNCTCVLRRLPAFVHLHPLFTGMYQPNLLIRLGFYYESGAPKAGVAGSIPAGRTNKIKGLARFYPVRLVKLQSNPFSDRKNLSHNEQIREFVSHACLNRGGLFQPFLRLQSLEFLHQRDAIVSGIRGNVRQNAPAKSFKTPLSSLQGQRE